MDLHGNGRFRPLGRWLYQRGYSTEVAIYCISRVLSIVGFSIMMWSYASLLSFADRQDLRYVIWSAHFHARFGVLAFRGDNVPFGCKHFISILTDSVQLLTVPIWFLVNLISLCSSHHVLPAITNINDLCVGTGLIYISMRCFKKLGRLNQSCGNSGHCIWIGAGPKLRHIAAIVLGVIVG